MSSDRLTSIECVGYPGLVISGELRFWQELRVPMRNGGHMSVDVPSDATADDIDHLIKHLGVLKESVVSA